MVKKSPTKRYGSGSGIQGNNINFIYIRMLIHKTIENAYNQFVYPNPEGSGLIVLAPFREGVIKDNQFAD